MSWYDAPAFRVLPDAGSTIKVDGKERVVRMWLKASDDNLDWNFKIVFADGGEITW